MWIFGKHTQFPSIAANFSCKQRIVCPDCVLASLLLVPPLLCSLLGQSGLDGTWLNIDQTFCQKSHLLLLLLLQLIPCHSLIYSSILCDQFFKLSKKVRLQIEMKYFIISTSSQTLVNVTSGDVINGYLLISRTLFSYSNSKLVEKLRLTASFPVFSLWTILQQQVYGSFPQDPLLPSSQLASLIRGSPLDERKLADSLVIDRRR